LTGGIAHDFNNLLAVMASSLGLFSTQPQDPPNIKLLESMRRAVERGATLTQQLLSLLVSSR
jgi:signal transduction histidine kinase